MMRAARWVRQNLFSSPGDAALTVAGVSLLALAAEAVLPFLVTQAVSLMGDVEACRSAQGACWPFIAAKLDQLLAGRYPADERWRCLAAVALPLAMLGVSYAGRRILGMTGGMLGVVAGILGAFALLGGGVAGLVPVSTEQWGGLTLTLMIAYVGMTASLPIGILLALARRSSWPVPRLLAIGFIEFWRGVPLVTVLFMASVMLPLFLPQGVDLEKLTRALIAVALFASAYVAEIVRGGLQIIPASQFEAAQAMGFSWTQTLRLIILPQALRNALPGLTGAFIGLLKDTTLVLVIGLFDFLGTVQLAAADPDWAAPSTALTGYVFAGAVFWMLCFAMSRVGAAIERQVPASAR